MTKSKKRAEQAKAAAGTKVYCGPTIRNICPRYAMFTEAPAPLMEKAKQVPLIHNLILPLADFVEARQQIEAGRGPYFNIYQQITKSL
nr:MAG TPA: hypothetical protein [Caudoviricetes sp.]